MLAELEKAGPTLSENFPTGYLLFDTQVQHYREWLAFGDSPTVRGLNEQIGSLSEQLAITEEQARLDDRRLQSQTDRLQSRLDDAFESARQARRQYADSRSLRSIAYRVVRLFNPVAAEGIIAYQTSQSDVRLAREEKRALVDEHKLAKERAEQEQISLKRHRYVEEVKLQDFTQSWLFGNEDRALFYAITNMGREKQAVDNFLLQYSLYTKEGSYQVRQNYIDLVVRLTPSLHWEATLKAGKPISVSSEEGAGKLDFNYRDWITISPTKKSGDPDAEDGNHGRKVILNVTDSPIELDGIPDEEFDRLVRKSGTPLTTEETRGIIQMLSLADPLREYQRYPHTVQRGDFKGFHVLKQGAKIRVLFKYGNGSVHVRFGDYYKVYGDGFKWQG